MVFNGFQWFSVVFSDHNSVVISDLQWFSVVFKVQSKYIGIRFLWPSVVFSGNLVAFFLVVTTLVLLVFFSVF